MAEIPQEAYEDLSARNAVARGAHGAVEDAVKYGTLALLAAAAIYVTTGKSPTQLLLKKLTK